MKKTFTILFISIILDFIFSQIFFLNYLEKKELNSYKGDSINRVYNKDYKYTFKKNSEFDAKYNNYYKIYTNDLGFRDSKVKKIDRTKEYTIVIGDSFVEGVTLLYDETIVGQLSKKVNLNFLNAGVSSYSSYIYLKKIIKIIDENPDLLIKDIIVLFDKSDMRDDLEYFNKPKYFENTKIKKANKRKNDFYKDLKELNFFRFYKKQTMSGKALDIAFGALEDFLGNLRNMNVMAKNTNKSFFDVSYNVAKSIRSIENRKWLAQLLLDEQWEEKGKKSINFAIDNMNELNFFLKKKNINLYIVLYPWSFEIYNKELRERYLSYTTNKLRENKLLQVICYEPFLTGETYQIIYENFIYSDVHYNAAGYKKLAKCIKDNIYK